MTDYLGDLINGMLKGDVVVTKDGDRYKIDQGKLRFKEADASSYSSGTGCYLNIERFSHFETIADKILVDRTEITALKERLAQLEKGAQ